MTTGVWEPRRVPLAGRALSSLSPDARASFESRFERPTDVQRHLWTAAARRESLVVSAPRHSGARVGLELAGTSLGGGTVSHADDAEGCRRLTLDVDGVHLVVVEPGRGARAIAEEIAASSERCGVADTVSYASIRTRVFAPFRDDPRPDAARLAPAFEQEMARMTEGGRVVDLRNEGAPSPAELPAAECVFVDGYRSSAVVTRAAASTDAPFHESPAVVLFAADWSETLLAYVVAARVRQGLLDADGVADTDSERVAREWASRVRAEGVSEERQAYALVAGLAMNRGNAIAVVRGARS